MAYQFLREPLRAQEADRLANTCRSPEEKHRVHLHSNKRHQTRKEHQSGVVATSNRADWACAGTVLSTRP